MGRENEKRFAKAATYMVSTIIAKIARGDKENVFVRVRKQSVYDILLSILSRKGLTASMEIRQFFKRIGKQKVTKQAWFKSRRKLNPKVFIMLNDDYMKSFYETENDVKTWNGYLVLAIDGSKAEIPNSIQNRRYYGTMGNDKTTGPARALISGLFDVLNCFFIDLQIYNVKTSEKELAKTNIQALERIGVKQKCIIVFDKGYPSLDLLNYLFEHELFYVVRIPNAAYKQERGAVKSNDEWICIENSAKRLFELKRKNEKRYHELKEKHVTHARLISDRTASGDEFSVLTNLPEEISGDEIINAYFYRWNIEQAYHTLKNKMKFESVTGMDSIYVEQDFLSQVYVYNLMEDIRQAVEEEIDYEKHNYKYPQRINQNVAIGIFKDEFINIMLEPELPQRTMLFRNLYEELKAFTLPKRKLKSTPRHHNLSNKYSCNIKPAF